MSVAKWKDLYFNDLVQSSNSENKSKLQFYHCILKPGDILYFPNRWMHATLNLDNYNFFISLFLDFQLITGSYLSRKQTF